MKHEISLPRELEDFVQSVVRQPRFTDINDVIVEGLYLLKDEFENFSESKKRLRSELRRAIDQADRGELVDGPAFMAQLQEIRPK